MSPEALLRRLEKLEVSKQEQFRRGHRVPGLLGFGKHCTNPQVEPWDIKIDDGIERLIDRCETCGATNTTSRGVLHFHPPSLKVE